MKKGVLALTCLLLLTGCGKEAEKPQENVKEEIKQVSVQLQDVEVEIGEDLLNTKGIVSIKDGELVTKEEKVETSVLGVQKVKIVAKSQNGEESEFEYNVSVVDKTAPVISYKNKLTTTEGKSFNILNGVSAKDNSLEKIKVTVEGEYDFNKAGTYNLYYVAKDSSGNETKNEFTLVVNEKKEEPKQEEKKEESKIENKEETKKEESEEKTTTEKEKSSTSTAKAGKGTDSSLNGTKTSKGYTITVKNGITYIDGVLIANKTYALPSSYVPSGTYGKLSGAYKEISKTGILKDAYSAYTKMQSAAKNAGYNIYIASGYRSYGYQEGLYNGYVKRNGKADADLGSARPGHSEHQTGLAFDLNTISNSSDNTKMTKWVLSNCYKYGYILRYPKGKTTKTGYKYEWWHLRYVGVDLATKLYNNGDWITLEEHFGITSKYDY